MNNKKSADFHANVDNFSKSSAKIFGFDKVRKKLSRDTISPNVNPSFIRNLYRLSLGLSAKKQLYLRHFFGGKHLSFPSDVSKAQKL